jgi:acetyl esterase
VTLDPQAKAYLDRMAALSPPAPWETTVEELRQAGEAAAPDLFGPVPSGPFEDREISGASGPIRARVYQPGVVDAPVLVYFHGGGWVIGSVDTHHGACATLAAEAGCAVVSVDYRLAPEHRCPTALEDAWEAAVWVSEHPAEVGGRAGALAVGGDSSGGNLPPPSRCAPVTGGSPFVTSCSSTRSATPTSRRRPTSSSPRAWG